MFLCKMTLSSTNRRFIAVIMAISCHVLIASAMERNSVTINKKNSSRLPPDQDSCSSCYGYDCCWEDCCEYMWCNELTESKVEKIVTRIERRDCPSCPTCPDPVTEPPCFTQPPCSNDGNPEFSKPFYQSSLPSWPTAGTTVHLGLNATTADNMPLRYQLVTSFEYLTLSAANDIIFTNNVSEGAYVGPNNVMVIEVVATVVGDESRSSSSTILIVFPRSVAPESLPIAA